MTDKQIKTLVDTAIALHREIATKTEQFKALKADLVEEARLHPEDLVETESGGQRWTAKGSDGSIARVNFPIPGIISEIEAPSDLATQIQAIVGDQFRKLFTTVKTYLPVDEFRAQANDLLPAAKVEALMMLCERESAPRVGFETTRRATTAATA